MKYLSLLLVISLLFMNSCKNVEEDSPDQPNPDLAYTLYGEEISAENYLSAAQMEEEFKDLKPGDTVAVSFKTHINSVCKNKGCWMTLDLPQEEDVMVQFKDYAFFVPKDIEEKEVVVNGKAYIAELSVDEQRHYAEDKGKTPEEIAAITEPKRTLSFLASGVLIKE